jgi:hypothetical protein
MVLFVIKQIASSDNRMTEISLGFPKSARAILASYGRN